MATWATTADVLTYTGKTVTDADLTLAETDVSVYANRAPSASAGMGARDLYWLKLACCYQASWRDGQVDVDSRQSVTSVSQDGVSVTYRAEWQVRLGPMAARAMKNLSWKAGRTQRTPNVRYPLGLGEYTAYDGDYQPGFLDESFDEAAAWNPL